MGIELNKKHIRRSFERASASYDGAAVVQRHMIDELIDRLGVLRLEPARILDMGCGTGYALQGLKRRFPGAEAVLLDFAASMLRHGRDFGYGPPYRICGDAEAMPVAAHSVDMVFSSAMLQWCDLGSVLTECLRVLKPGGLIMFATFGPDTLMELRASWKKVDAEIHVHEFTDMHNIGDALVQGRFATPVMDVDYLTVTHRDLNSALRDLRELGAGNAAADRCRGLLGKDRFARWREAHEGFRNADGLLESTCEIIYGHAWAPASINQKEEDGGVAVPISQLRR